MSKFLKWDIKIAFIVYLVLDIFMVGAGMGVPFFCILFGFPVGWYLARRFYQPEISTKTVLGSILRYSIVTSFVTLIFMALLWGWFASVYLVPGADLANTGIPMILFEPYWSFLGWIILMVIISPFLQWLTTIAAAYLTLWRLGE